MRRLAMGVCVMGTILVLEPASAAVPKKSLDEAARAESPAARAVTMDATRAALALPFANRVSVLREQGPAGYRNLVAIMFDASASTNLRWRAVTAAGRIGGRLARPELERAVKAKDWFMRSAALTAMTQIDGRVASEWARELLSDKALVVRAAAVDTIANLADRGSLGLLWTKLYAPENYKGQQSLFIRRRIVETLARLESSSDNVNRFVQVLGDKDETLHAPAVRALEGITKVKLGGEKDPVKFKREYWQKWWQERAVQTSTGV